MLCTLLTFLIANHSSKVLLLYGKKQTEYVFSNIYPTRCNVTQFIYIWKLLYMFRVVRHPSTGAQTTVSTASGICHTVTATCR